jgi:hypothetical protein
MSALMHMRSHHAKAATAPIVFGLLMAIAVERIAVHYLLAGWSPLLALGGHPDHSVRSTLAIRRLPTSQFLCFFKGRTGLPARFGPLAFSWTGPDDFKSCWRTTLASSPINLAAHSGTFVLPGTSRLVHRHRQAPR